MGTPREAFAPRVAQVPGHGTGRGYAMDRREFLQRSALTGVGVASTLLISAKKPEPPGQAKKPPPPPSPSPTQTVEPSPTPTATPEPSPSSTTTSPSPTASERPSDSDGTPAAVGTVLSGLWGPTPGDGSDWESFQLWEGRLGHKVPVFRSRGGEGQFDRPWVLAQSLKAATVGRTPSLQVQPKTGQRKERYGIPYTDIAAGKYDDVIRAGLAEYKLLPGGRRYPVELHSEANVQDPPPAAQPYCGKPDEYPGFALRIQKLAEEVGVRDRLIFILSMTRSPWNSGDWKVWTNGLDRVIDVYAVDGYSRPASGSKKEFAYIVQPVIAAARSRGKPWAVMETGCQEDPADPTYKAAWYGRLLAKVRNDADDLFGVVFNVSNDGSGGWMPTTSARSLDAFRSMMGDGVWAKL